MYHILLDGMKGCKGYLPWTVVTGKKPSLLPVFHFLELILSLVMGAEEHELYTFIC